MRQKVVQSGFHRDLTTFSQEDHAPGVKALSFYLSFELYS